MTIQVDIQFATACSRPSPKEIKYWISAALNGRKTAAIVSVRIVDQPEITELNKTYRQKDKPTNILSFPCLLPDAIRGDLLGDLVICAPVIEAEAVAQGKTWQSHWAHMLVHGTLHLLGYDHEEETMAQEMESLEATIMQALGFADPYGVEKTHER